MDIWINTTCFYTFYRIISWPGTFKTGQKFRFENFKLKSQLGDIEPVKLSSKGNAFPSNGEKSSESVRSLESF